MKVLVIEDDLEIVEAISLAFCTKWPEAELISSQYGKMGVVLAKSKAPDVIILDLALPDIDGYEVLEKIRHFSTVPVVILSVRSDETDIARGLQLGANDYVVKPFKQSELLPRLKDLVAHYISDRLNPP